MEYEEKILNKFSMEFLSVPNNVAMARITVASFAAQLDLTLDELEEIKVATSEAVSNAVIHGYVKQESGWVKMEGTIYDGLLEIIVEDKGCGIQDVEQAMEPTFTSDPERMGLGFVFMKSFMDRLQVESKPGEGTKVTMVKKINKIAHEHVLES